MSLSLLSSNLMDATDRGKISSSPSGHLMETSTATFFGTYSRRSSFLGEYPADLTTTEPPRISNSPPQPVSTPTAAGAETIKATTTRASKSSVAPLPQQGQQREDQPSSSSSIAILLPVGTLAAAKAGIVNSSPQSLQPNHGTTARATSHGADFKLDQDQLDEYWQVIRQEAITKIANNKRFGAEDNQEVERLDDETLRGITQRPSGAWQAQIYYAGKTRYIGCFERKILAARVYQFLRETLKKKKTKRPSSSITTKTRRGWGAGTTETVATTSSLCTSCFSLPPLKKRRVQGKDVATDDTGVAIKTNDNTYHFNAINAAQRTQGPQQGFAALSHMALNASYCTPIFAPGLFNPALYPSMGGMCYAPLLPPIHPPTNGHHSLTHRYQQHQVSMQMMPPPPPLIMGSSLSMHTPRMGYYQNATTTVSGTQAKPVTNKTTTNKKAPKDSIKSLDIEKKWKEIRDDVLDSMENIDVAKCRASVTMDSELLRGITQRPSGKYQAQIYFSGQSRYIGVFDSKEHAAFAYEMIRKKVKTRPSKPCQTVAATFSPKRSPAAVAKPLADSMYHASATTANRAITPSPTTVGGKYGRVSYGAAAYNVPASLKNMMTVAGVVSPLRNNVQAPSPTATTSEGTYGVSTGYRIPPQHLN